MKVNFNKGWNLSMEKREKLKIALKCRMYRTRHGLSQTEFGLRLGVSKTAISYFERGEWTELSERLIISIKEAISRSYRVQVTSDGKLMPNKNIGGSR